MINGIKVKATVLALILAGTNAIFTAQIPAFGFVSDPTVVSRLTDKRKYLLNRESNLLREHDDLLRKIDEMKRRSDSDAQIQMNELCSRSDSKYAELRQVRIDLRDVEMRLL